MNKAIIDYLFLLHSNEQYYNICYLYYTQFAILAEIEFPYIVHIQYS
jgi:hypothetical protein